MWCQAEARRKVLLRMWKKGRIVTESYISYQVSDLIYDDSMGETFSMLRFWKKAAVPKSQNG